jgi:hypothetical protein
MKKVGCAMERLVEFGEDDSQKRGVEARHPFIRADQRVYQADHQPLASSMSRLVSGA